MTTPLSTFLKATVPGAADASGDRLLRFGLTIRMAHWLHTVAFFGLLLSGLAMLVPAFPAYTINGLRVLRLIHLASAVLFIYAPLLSLMLGDWDEVTENVRQILRLDASDLAWLKASLVSIFKRDTTLPAQGKFNAGQKVNTVVVVLISLGFTGTGLLMWSTVLPTAWRATVSAVHNLLTALVLPLVVGHILLALVVPEGRGSLPGMVSGWVDRAWAERRHGRWAHPPQT